ncbi:class I SAM-dependent methyltransferase [Actinomadura sp. 1N219]|uniref:class I SAM-dependent methyltransferase n=1 Tax=Actinomadura sp. 1N219 TaxID=3375152 RepID=UPI0037944A31
MTEQSQATAVYGRDVSEVYDEFYEGRGQDFASQSETVARIVGERKPGARSILDVACGTGRHLHRLASHFPEVGGVELSAHMCTLARSRVPEASIVQGDMRDFRVSRSFAAVCCLTSSIAYMPTEHDLRAAVATMAGHLVPGGVLVIDPGWSPDTFLDGYVAHDVVRGEDRTVARLSHSRRTGVSVRHEAHYLVADASGIRHFTHVQPLTLFSPAQYLGALERAGCAAAHLTDEAAFADRGLFVGVRGG